MIDNTDFTEWSIHPAMGTETNASDFVFNQIFNGIAVGEYPPGSRLPSGNALCEKYGVSYVTIRAALQRLVALDLVETNTGGGTYVKSAGLPGMQAGPGIPFMEMPAEEIREMLEYRQWMEAEAAFLCAQKATAQDLEKLRKIYEKLFYYHINGTTELYSKMDYTLHNCIAEMSGNSLLKRVQDILSNFFQQQIDACNIYLGRDWGFDEHTLLVKAIEKKDAHAARFHAWEHVESTMELWEEYWKQNDTPHS